MTTGTDEAAEQFCTIASGLELCYRIDGRGGEPLVLLNGLTLDLTAWPASLVAGLVSRGFRVIRPDNRDAGRSSSVAAPAPSMARLAVRRVREAPYDLGDMADDMIGLLDHLEIDRAHLVGMSMGGMIAQTMAARHPERVLTLTSMCSTTGHSAAGQPSPATTMRLLRPPARSRVQGVEHALGFARHISSRGYEFDAVEARRRIVATMHRHGEEAPRARMLRQIAAIQASGDRTRELRGVIAPTAVIHGDHDVLVDPSGGTATMHAITGARLHTIEGMGHELPEAVVPRIVDIIRTHAHPESRPAPGKQGGDRVNAAIATSGSDLEVTMPPGPRLTNVVPDFRFPLRPTATLQRLVRRYGPTFTVKLPLMGPTVVVTDPETISDVLHQPAEIVGGMEPNLSVVLGKGSIFGLQGDEHRRRRRLVTPPFHGEKLRAFEAIIEQETRKAIAGWPESEEFSTIECFNRITLNVILRAVFGAAGEELDELRSWMPQWIRFGSALFPFPFLHHDWGPWSPWGRHLANRRRFAGIVDRLIDQAQADPEFERRNDVLTLMLTARYEDGTAMSREEIGDELLSILIAGHETTATALAWCVERLRRHPDLLTRLVEEVEAGEARLLQATVHEVLRTRPILVGTPRKVVAETMQLGEWVIPRGTNLYIAACVAQNDERLFPNPTVFDPDRFLGEMPNIYAWTPFGGGIRRCLGAAFANMEMIVVLRTILDSLELIPTEAADEKVAFRGVAYAPGKGGRAVVRRRSSRPHDQED